MGYLNNSSIVVDATLTKKGRELLARGQNEFVITHFGLSDDEINYDLWNPDHPLGSEYYGAAIENLPLIEALVDETQSMKYKLVTLPKKTVRIPIISIGQTAVTLTSGEEFTITPQTINLSNGNANFGYTAVLSDSDVASFVGVNQTPAQRSGNDTSTSTPTIISDNEAAQSVSVTGTSFTIQGKGSTLKDRKAVITIIGNETGGRQTINLTVSRITTGTGPNASITD
jgi:hypothetical protein